MKTIDFFNKLFENGQGTVKLSVTGLEVNMKIDHTIFKDNLDLVSKELHMEVDLLMNKKRTIKYDKVEVNSQKLLDEFAKNRKIYKYLN